MENQEHTIRSAFVVEYLADDLKLEIVCSGTSNEGVLFLTISSLGLGLSITIFSGLIFKREIVKNIKIIESVTSSLHILCAYSVLSSCDAGRQRLR